MSSASGQLWLHQARSDFECGEIIRKAGDEVSYCHVLAKYQQCVEKALKGVVAALYDAKITQMQPVRRHDLEHELLVLREIPFSKKTTVKSIIGRVKKGLDNEVRNNVRRIVSLAPGPPDEDGLETRNTEYPYQKEDGVWTIPATMGAFSNNETEEFRDIAQRTLNWAESIVFQSRLMHSRRQE